MQDSKDLVLDIRAKAGRTVAILRGLQPGEVVAIGRVLVGAGIRTIDVPLNSPDTCHKREAH